MFPFFFFTFTLAHSTIKLNFQVFPFLSLLYLFFSGVSMWISFLSLLLSSDRKNDNDIMLDEGKTICWVDFVCSFFATLKMSRRRRTDRMEIDFQSVPKMSFEPIWQGKFELVLIEGIRQRQIGGRKKSVKSHFGSLNCKLSSPKTLWHFCAKKKMSPLERYSFIFTLTVWTS